MIVSKLDKAKMAYEKAAEEMRTTLVTKRGAKDARVEMTELRSRSLESGVCAYCNKDIYSVSVRSSRHPEACSECGSLIDRMLQLKSKIAQGCEDPAVVKQLLAGYEVLEYVPYALRGVNGETADVIEKLEFFVVALTNYKIEIKAARARSAECAIVTKEKDNIRAMLLHCGMSLNDPNLEVRVNAIYNERHLY